MKKIVTFFLVVLMLNSSYGQKLSDNYNSGQNYYSGDFDKNLKFVNRLFNENYSDYTGEDPGNLNGEFLESPYPPSTGAVGTTHKGIDYRAKDNFDLYSPLSGKVTDVGGTYGEICIYNSTYDLTFIFLHCSSFLVAKGDNVIVGQNVGKSGSTGAPGSPHLHIELRNGCRTAAQTVEATDTTNYDPRIIMDYFPINKPINGNLDIYGGTSTHSAYSDVKIWCYPPNGTVDYTVSNFKINGFDKSSLIASNKAFANGKASFTLSYIGIIKNTDNGPYTLEFDVTSNGDTTHFFSDKLYFLDVNHYGDIGLVAHDSYAYKYIKAGTRNGLFKGYKSSDGRWLFNPDGVLTKGQAAKVVVNAMLNLGMLTGIDAVIRNGYPKPEENKASEFFPYIQTLYNKDDMILPYTNEEFKANEKITVSEFCWIINKAFNLSNTAIKNLQLPNIEWAGESNPARLEAAKNISKVFTFVTDEYGNKIGAEPIASFFNYIGHPLCGFPGKVNLNCPMRRSIMAKVLSNLFLLKAEANSIPINKTKNIHSQSNLTANDLSQYMIIGTKFESEDLPFGNTPALSPNIQSSYTISDSESLTLTHPSATDAANNGAPLYFYWSVSGGESFQPLKDNFQSVKFTPGKVNEPTSYMLYSLVGNTNGKVREYVSTIHVIPTFINTTATTTQVTTVCGNPGIPVTQSGSINTASFSSPNFLAVDGMNNITVVERTFIKQIPEMDTYLNPNSEELPLSGFRSYISVIDQNNKNVRLAYGNSTVLNVPSIAADGTVYVPTDAGVNYLEKKLYGDNSNTFILKEPELIDYTLGGNDYDINSSNWKFCFSINPINNRIYSVMYHHQLLMIDPNAAEVKQIVSDLGFDTGSDVYTAFNPKEQNILYLSVTNNHSIYRVDLNQPSPVAIPYAGLACKKTGIQTASEFAYADGTLTQSRFSYPRQITFDKEGIMYIADCVNHCIRSIDTKTGIVSTFAGKGGEKGYVNGSASEARFSYPMGIAIGGDGAIYVADTRNSSIRKIYTSNSQSQNLWNEVVVINTQKGIGSSISLKLSSTTNYAIDWGDGIKKVYTKDQTQLNDNVRGNTLKIFAFNNSLSFFESIGNKITSINVDNCTSLEKLSISNNLISLLNLNNSTNLKYLECANNSLTGLDVRFNLQLKYLNISGNKLSSESLKNTYNQLPNVSSLQAENELDKQLVIVSNPGASTSLIEIATNKGWKIDVNAPAVTVLSTSQQSYGQDISLKIIQTVLSDIFVDWGNGVLKKFVNNVINPAPAVSGISHRTNELIISGNISGDSIRIYGSSIVGMDCSSKDVKGVIISNGSNIEEFNCSDNNLDACALNALYESLPVVSNGVLNNSNNPGTLSSNTQIAQNKGWTVAVIGNGAGCLGEMVNVFFTQSDVGSIKVYKDNELLISGSKVSVGTLLRVEAIPSDGYELSYLNANKTSFVNTFTVLEETQIVANFEKQPNVITLNNIENVSYCSGSNINVSYNMTGVWDQGTMFEVQLSDSDGSFENPTEMAFFPNTENRNITAQVPNNIPGGNNYRIRIASLDKQFISNISEQISISTSATPTIAVSGGEVFCSSELAQFRASGNNLGSSPVYQWFINGAPVGTNSSSFSSILSDGDVLQVKATSSESCVTQQEVYSNQRNVIVVSQPDTPVISQFDDILVSSAMEGNQWYKDNQPIEGAVNQFYLPDENGEYSVIVSANPCATVSSKKFVYSVHTGLSNVKNQVINIYPNPVINDLFIKTPSEKSVIKIYSLQGSLLKTVAAYQSNDQIDVSTLQSGVYLVKISGSDGKVYTGKFVKE